MISNCWILVTETINSQSTIAYQLETDTDNFKLKVISKLVMEVVQSMKEKYFTLYNLSDLHLSKKCINIWSKFRISFLNLRIINLAINVILFLTTTLSRLFYLF